MKIKGGEIKFSSGRSVYANCGIVGINSALELHEGYDGTISWPIPDWWRIDHPEWINDKTLTADDMCELADCMIGLWSKFKATLEPQSSAQTNSGHDPLRTKLFEVQNTLRKYARYDYPSAMLLDDLADDIDEALKI